MRTFPQLGMDIMRLRLVFSVCSFGLCAACWSSATFAQSTPAEPTKAVRLDPEGMPLPAGALYRLGSVRLRDPLGSYDFAMLDGGRTLLSAGVDGVLRYWDLDSGKVKRAVRIRDEKDLLDHITLTPDDRFAMIEVNTQQNFGRQEAKLKLYDVGAGKEVKTNKTSATWAISRELSPNGKYVAMANWLFGKKLQARLTVQDWATGTERETSLHDTNAEGLVITGGSFAPNGKWFVVCGFGDEPSRIIDVETGAEISRLGKWNIETTAFSADSKVLALSCYPQGEADNRSSLRLLKMPGGEFIARHTIPATFTSLAMSNDGKQIAGSAEQVFLIEASTGHIRHQFGAHADKLRFSRDDKTLVCLCGRTFHLFEVATGKEISAGASEFHITGEPTPAISPDGKTLAFLDRERLGISLWDLPNRKLVRQLPISADELYGLHQLVFRDEGKRLSALGELGHLLSWSTETGRSERQVDVGDRMIDVDWPKLSSDGRYVAMIQSPGRVRGDDSPNKLIVRSAATGAVLHSSSVPPQWWCSQWLPDGGSLLVRGQGDDFILVKVENGGELARFKAPETYEFRPSSDGRLLAANRVKVKQTDLIVWERLTCKEVARLPIGMPNFSSDEFFADDKTLVAVDEHAIELWDLDTQQVRYRLSLDFKLDDINSHLHVVRAIQLPGGRELLTVLSDGSGLVWDISAAFKPIVVAADQRAGEKSLAECWVLLASDDARVAFKAIWRLEALPESWRFVIERLRKERADPEDKTVREFISQLDSDQFQVRQKANGELEKMNSAAVPAMRDALGKTHSPEMKRRLEQLLAKWPANTITPLLLRRLRALQILEFANNAESKEALGALVKNPVWEMEREEAQAALNRLEEKSKMRP